MHVAGKAFATIANLMPGSRGYTSIHEGALVAGQASVCEGQRPCVSRYQDTAMGGLVCLAIVKAPSRSRSQKRSPFKPTERRQTAAVRHGLRSRPFDTP